MQEICFGRRPAITVAWGNAPGIRDANVALAEGHIHPDARTNMNMAVGQMVETESAT